MSCDSPGYAQHPLRLRGPAPPGCAYGATVCRFSNHESGEELMSVEVLNQLKGHQVLEGQAEEEEVSARILG